MEFVSQLWQPILVSAALVWVASFLAWMVFPHHKGEWNPVPDEEGFLAALRERGLKPGQYMFPHGTPADMKDPAFAERYRQGPRGTLVVWGGPPNMGRNMLLSLLLYIVVGCFVAYLGWHAMGPDQPYLKVFRITGVAAVLAYAAGSVPNDIWFGRPGRSMLTNLVDAVVYGLLTAGAFGWLWPEA